MPYLTSYATDGTTASKPATGVMAYVPWPVTFTYDTGKSFTATPRQNGVTVSAATGAGPVAVAVTGTAIAITSILPGTTTYAQIKAAWDAATSAVADPLTGDAGTIPVGYAGFAATALRAERVMAGGVALKLNPSGEYIPAACDATGHETVEFESGSTVVATGAAGAALALDSRLVETAPGTATTADLLRKIAGTAGAEKSLADVQSDTAAVKTATEKAATEITVGQGAPSRPFLPRTSGATPTQQQGVPGHMQRDYTYTIAAGKTISVHPKRAGASFSVATAGAAAVSASGLAVVLTSKNDDSTTVAAMQALIAASPTVAALVSISGTALDAFDHTLTLADTPLWYEGTIPANLLCALGPDGYIWPVELDATGGVKVSMSSVISGEDSVRGVLRTEQQPASSGWLAASTAVVAAGIAGRMYDLICQVSGGAGCTINLRAGGVIGGTILRQVVLTADGPYYIDLGNRAYTNGLYVEINAGTVSFDLGYRNG